MSIEGRWRNLPLLGAVCLLTLFLCGCETTYDEWSGNMANARASRHVAAYTPAQERAGGQGLTPGAADKAAGAPFPEQSNYESVEPTRAPSMAARATSEAAHPSTASRPAQFSSRRRPATRAQKVP
jgi:hypothetical protein